MRGLRELSSAGRRRVCRNGAVHRRRFDRNVVARICTKDINILGSVGFTGNDLPFGVDMLYRTRKKYPWLDMQTLYPFSEEESRALSPMRSP